MRRLKFLALFFWTGLLLGFSLWRFPLPFSGGGGLLRAFASAALVLLGALAVGRAALLRFGLFHGSFVEEATFSLGLGFVVLSLLGSALGALGVLYPWTVLLLLFLLYIVHWEQLEALADALRRSLRTSHPWQGGGDEVAALLALALSGAAVTALCLAPPSFYDALVYHLAQAQRAAVSGVDEAQRHVLFTWLPELPGPLWSQALSLGGAPLDDVRAAALLNLAAFGCLALLLLDAGARLLGERRLWLVPSLALTQPLLALSFGVFSPDGWMALYAFLSLNAFLLALNEKPLRRQGAWLLLAALFAGAAVACKPVALAHAAALLMLVGLRVFQEPGLRRHRLLLGGVALFMMPLLPWLLRGWIVLGQPFYPFPVRFFGYSLGAGAPAVYFDHVQSFGGRSLADHLHLPYDFFFAPARLGGGGPVGFLLLALMPAVLAGRLDREMRWAGLYVLLGLGLWAAGPRVLRYALWFLPAASLVAAQGVLEAEAWALSRTWSGLWRGLVLLCLALAGLQTLAIAQKDFDPLDVALGLESPDRYLERREVPGPKVMNWIRTHGGHDASRVLLLGDARSAWLPARTLAASAFEEHPLAAWVAQARDPQDLDASLRRKGYDFVVFNAAEWARLGGQTSAALRYWPANDASARQRFFDWLDHLQAGPSERRLSEPGLLVVRLR